MKIGVLGGSFDPPHFGHLSLARQLLVNGVVDEILFVPCFSHAFNKKMSKVADRFAMTKLVAEEKIKVSDFEVRRPEISYTIDTMDFFTKTYPENEFYWILGSDQLFVFEKYHEWKSIIQKHNLIVYPRENDFEKICAFVDGLIAKARESQSIIVLDPKEFKTNDLSSTEIRGYVKNGKNISKMVPKEVEEYIIKNKLYI